MTGKDAGLYFEIVVEVIVSASGPSDDACDPVERPEENAPSVVLVYVHHLVRLDVLVSRSVKGRRIHDQMPDGFAGRAHRKPLDLHFDNAIAPADRDGSAHQAPQKPDEGSGKCPKQEENEAEEREHLPVTADGQFERFTLKLPLTIWQVFRKLRGG